jgi:hypothetical protein
VTSEEYHIDDVFKYIIEENFMTILKRLSLSQPKAIFKRLEELFSDSELQTILPLIFLKKIQALSNLTISIRLQKRQIDLPLK